MMSVTAEELTALIGKKAILHVVQGDGTLAELEGKVEAASSQGLAFKQKGKSSVDLYEISQLEEINAAPETPKKIRQSKTKPIEAGLVRKHLVDRHGMPISQANNMTEEQAVELHNQIDHSDLGHRHEAPETTSQEEALAKAEDEEDVA